MHAHVWRMRPKRTSLGRPLRAMETAATVAAAAAAPVRLASVLPRPGSSARSPPPPCTALKSHRTPWT